MYWPGAEWLVEDEVVLGPRLVVADDRHRHGLAVRADQDDPRARVAAQGVEVERAGERQGHPGRRRRERVGPVEGEAEEPGGAIGRVGDDAQVERSRRLSG